MLGINLSLGWLKSNGIPGARRKGLEVAIMTSDNYLSFKVPPLALFGSIPAGMGDEDSFAYATRYREADDSLSSRALLLLRLEGQFQDLCLGAVRKLVNLVVDFTSARKVGVEGTTNSQASLRQNLLLPA
jgi:hypothetical protein